MSKQTYHRDPECLFCKIISREIPCFKVFEDSHILAFLDINPAAKGHTLVVPKHHAPTLLEMPVSGAEPLVTALQRVGRALMAETGAEGFNCIQNNFQAAGQVIFHAHWHVIPRFSSDNLLDFPSGNPLPQDEMQLLAASLHNRLG